MLAHFLLGYLKFQRHQPVRLVGRQASFYGTDVISPALQPAFLHSSLPNTVVTNRELLKQLGLLGCHSRGRSEAGRAEACLVCQLTCFPSICQSKVLLQLTNEVSHLCLISLNCMAIVLTL